MRPRKVILLRASCEAQAELTRFLLCVWGYRAVAQTTRPPAAVLLDGLLEPHHAAEMREAWSGVPVLALVPGLTRALTGSFQAAGAHVVLDPLTEGNCTVREQLRVMCKRKRGPKRLLERAA